MDDFFNLKNEFFHNKNELTSDEEKLELLTMEIKKYDILDFVCKLSSLNLIPYNQNKSLIFDKIIDHILLSNIAIDINQNKMSMKKFKQILDSAMKLNMAKGIDPVEMPFIQRIQFFGNKWIFSGINSAPAYVLQNFIDVLIKQENDFDESFITRINHIIHFILEISTKIVEDNKYTNDVFKHHEIQYVFYPSSCELSKLSQSIIFTETEFDNIIDEKFRNMIYYKREHDIDMEFEGENCSFYYSPFIKLKDNKFLVLNASMLAPFAVYNIIKLSDEYGIKEKVVNLYNDEMWKKCKMSLSGLGHRKINEKALGIQLFNTDQYKETILNASNDGILFVRYFCDNAKDYNYSNMFETTVINVEDIEEKWKEISDLEGVLKKDKVYQLTIINSFGRGVMLPFSRATCPKKLSLSPFELYCVSINEQAHSNFILYYIESKQRVDDLTMYYSAEINYLSLYTSNNYSFYINDEVDVRKTKLCAGYGDSVDYLNKALLKQDRQLAEIPTSNFLREIVLNEETRNIYCSIDHKDFSLMNRFKNVDIWTNAKLPSSLEELNVVRSVLDLVAYWLSEFEKAINMCDYKAKTIIIENYFTGNAQDYFLVNDVENDNISSHLSFKIEDCIIKLFWTPRAFACLATKDNLAERELMWCIIEKISSFSNTNLLEKVNLDETFKNPLKTKVYALNYMEHPYFKPIDEKIRYIPQECEHQLLDEIGYHLIYDKKYDYGIIKNKEKNLICNEIVSFLYEKLQSAIKTFSCNGFYEMLYYDLERIMFSMMLMQRRYAYDLACYPEKKEKIDTEYNEVNKSSVATKFLLEYIAAVPPSGKVPLGECDYEYLLTICSLIIEWAHNSDMFMFKMIGDDLEILKSGRIGLNKDKLEKLAKDNYVVSRKRLNDISNPYVELYFPHKLVTNDEMDKAFLDEFKYTYTELYQCIMKIIEIGDSIKSEVKRKSKDDVYKIILESLDFTEDKVSRIIDDFSLTQRDDFMKPPSPYNKHDVSPWKFNRRLSFIRRPITQIGNDLMWGNRQLYHSLLFLYDLVANGRLPVSKGGKFKSYIAKLTDQRGNDFNDVVAEKMKSFDSIIVDSKVKKINKKRIANDQGNDLGDIDVLAIIPSKKRIVVIEVKDFALAKSPYEMHQEYLNVFCDKEDELCYISKHKRRVEWMKKHIDDVKKHYKLVGDNWKVSEALVVDESIVSNEFYHQKQKIILFSDLSKEVILKI